MSIKSVIERSKDDLRHFQSKSYHNIDLKHSIIKTSELFLQTPISEMMQRLYEQEYQIDGVEEVIKIENLSHNIITINQIKDLFDDIGFNVDTTFSATHGGDFAISYNLGGFLIPFWKNIIKHIYPRNYKTKRILINKLGPGKKRLHCRLYQDQDGSWYITSHIDEANWLNITSPRQLYKTHIQKAGGNYIDGSKLMAKVISLTQENFNNRSTLFLDIDQIYRSIK